MNETPSQRKMKFKSLDFSPSAGNMHINILSVGSNYDTNTNR